MGLSAEYAIEGEGAGATLVLGGRFTIARLGSVADAAEQRGRGARPLARIDLGQIERIDTVGAWVVERIVGAQRRRGGRREQRGR